MKYRLTVLIVILSMALVSCSLAEDITPPPGYQSPTSVSTLAPATQTPESTLTTEPATIESTPARTQSTNPPADVTTMPGAPIGNITGTLANGSGGGIPEGQKVTLVGFDQDQAGSYQKTIELESPVNPDGSYSFTGVDVPLNRAFLIITSFEGVEYQSDPVFVKDETTNFSIPITIYDKTNDFNVLTIDQVHLKFDLSSQDVIQVTELYIVTNPSKQVVVVPSDGTTIPFMQTPVGAGSLQYQLSQGSAQLLNATGGFALLPGADKQYGFLVSFTMSYNRSMKYDQPFSLPVSSLTVFIPQGMRLSGEQLTAAGTQTIQSQSYLMYQTNNMASGSLLSLSLSGKPGASTGFTFDRQTIVLIGIGVVGILLIGVGIYLYLRDRARILKAENEANEGQIDDDALGEDRDNIIDAMVALDDQYKAGEIPKQAYEKRRMELKERLRGIL
jgi:hypothetical protein